MNAASILKYFIKKRIIKLNKKKIIEICRLIGSDVILGLNCGNSILSSSNKIRYFKKSDRFYTLIVKPNFGCSTKEIYSKVKRFSKPEFNSISKNILSVKFLKKKKNDLEMIAFNEYSKLKNLKNFLDSLPNIEFVRMTGSGSAIIAYFSSAKKCKEAEKKVKNQFRKYWCKTSKTI